MIPPRLVSFVKHFSRLRIHSHSQVFIPCNLNRCQSAKSENSKAIAIVMISRSCLVLKKSGAGVPKQGTVGHWTCARQVNALMIASLACDLIIKIESVVRISHLKIHRFFYNDALELGLKESRVKSVLISILNLLSE